MQDLKRGRHGQHQKMIPALIYLASVLARFLCKTGRGIKAIELCKEGLVLLNNEALEKVMHLRNFCLGYIYLTMIKAYYDCHNYKNATEYGRKFLSLLRQCGETVLEGMISIALAGIYFRFKTSLLRHKNFMRLQSKL